MLHFDVSGLLVLYGIAIFAIWINGYRVALRVVMVSAGAAVLLWLGLRMRMIAINGDLASGARHPMLAHALNPHDPVNLALLAALGLILLKLAYNRFSRSKGGQTFYFDGDAGGPDFPPDFQIRGR